MSCCSFHGCGDCEAAAIPYSSLAERHNMWLNAQSLHMVTLEVVEFETVFGVGEDIQTLELVRRREPTACRDNSHGLR